MPKSSLRPAVAVTAAFVLAGLPLASHAHDLPYEVVRPDAYQSFVKNWTPESRPRCAVIASRAQWDAVMAPAPVMGPNRPFAPPDEFWKGHALLLVARVMPAGDPARALAVDSVARRSGAIQVAYRFTPPPRASSTIKAWVAVSVAKPLASIVVFKGSDGISCKASR